MYNIDGYVANSAQAGLLGKAVVSLSYRNQWDKLSGSPRVFQLNFSAPLKQINGAIGGSILSERSGLHVAQALRASYNQVFSTSKYLISYASGLSYYHNALDYNAIRTPDGEYNSGSIDHNDPNLIASRLDLNNIGFFLATYIQTKVLEGGIEYDHPILYLGNSSRIFKKERLLKFYLAKEFDLGLYKMVTSLFDLTDFRQNQEEIQININYKNKFSGGLLWRGLRSSSADAIGTQFGFNLNKGVWLFYLVEWPLNSLKNEINSINQQFGLKFEFNTSSRFSRLPIIYNPRW